MIARAGLAALSLALSCAGCATAVAQDSPRAARTPAAVPTVIAHRGASGYLPEHTLAAYWLAIEQGADYVEPDLVITRDGVLIARHENAIAVLAADGSVREATTDVMDHPEFADRKTTKVIDGTSINGWFTEDFTLAELKTLRARERVPKVRPANARFDGMFEIPTLDEVLVLVAQANERRRGRGLKPIGVYPETKHPSYFESIKMPLEAPLLRTLKKHGYDGPDAPVFIQSFEVKNLRELSRVTRLPLVQLLGNSGRPYDFTVANDPRTYADLVKPEGLREIATYASGIGAHTNLMIPLAGGRLGTPTKLVENAHAAGLLVHGWTFRAENTFLPDEFDGSANANELGNLAGQIDAFLALGMDGFFTDQAFLGRKARDAFVGRK